MDTTKFVRAVDKFHAQTTSNTNEERHQAGYRQLTSV